MKSRKKKVNNILKFIRITAIIVIIFIISICVKTVIISGRNKTETGPESIEISTIKVAKTVDGSTPYNGKITADTDLLNRVDITEDQLNYILKYYTEYEENKNSVFINKGYLFCEASNETGLDAIFIIIISANTYGWDYETGDKQFEENVLALSRYIYNTWYSTKNCHTLNDMIESDNYKYAISDDWADTIARAMDEAYKLIY